MNSATLRLLGIIVAVLVVALVVLESRDEGSATDNGSLMLPGFRDHVNEVTSLRVERHGEDPVVIDRQDDHWVVPSRDGYAADMGKVREVLLAMADARTMEAKTANPELLGRLGLQLPDVDDSKGTLLTAAAADDEYQLLLGNVAQTKYRYARRPDEDQTWLIDQNPDIPASAGDWLSPDIIDIDSSAVRAVTIVHPGGETISVEKAAEDDANFTVNDVPEGRELSYTTVANGMGGALNDLELDDVRPAAAVGDDAVKTTFETFDGMTVTVDTQKTDDGSWITLSASGTGADELNARLSGWQFKVADYKANLLTRGWQDILKPEAEAETDEE